MNKEPKISKKEDTTPKEKRVNISPSTRKNKRKGTGMKKKKRI